MSTSIVATDLAERMTYVPTANINQISVLEATGASPPFKPTFLIGCAIPTAQKDEELRLMYEVEIAFDLVFRGTRTDNGIK